MKNKLIKILSIGMLASGLLGGCTGSKESVITMDYGPQNQNPHYKMVSYDGDSIPEAIRTYIATPKTGSFYIERELSKE